MLNEKIIKRPFLAIIASGVIVFLISVVCTIFITKAAMLSGGKTLLGAREKMFNELQLTGTFYIPNLDVVVNIIFGDKYKETRLAYIAFCDAEPIRKWVGPSATPENLFTNYAECGYGTDVELSASGFVARVTITDVVFNENGHLYYAKLIQDKKPLMVKFDENKEKDYLIAAPIITDWYITYDKLLGQFSLRFDEPINRNRDILFNFGTETMNSNYGFILKKLSYATSILMSLATSINKYEYLHDNFSVEARYPYALAYNDESTRVRDIMYYWKILIEEQAAGHTAGFNEVAWGVKRKFMTVCDDDQ